MPPVEPQTAVTVSVSPSTSVSFARMRAETLAVVASSTAGTVSSPATGASFTEVTVMWIVALSLPWSLWAVYVVDVVPCQFAVGVNV